LSVVICCKAIEKTMLEQKIMATDVAIKIFPSPAKGDIIPPNKNAMAPSMAEAVPAFCRFDSNASVVDDGKINPLNTNIINMEISK
jgi:hypothetical protein